MVAVLHTPSFRSTATALLVAAGVLFSSGRAAASCGDYVTIAGQPTVHDHATPPAGNDSPVPRSELLRRPERARRSGERAGPAPCLETTRRTAPLGDLLGRGLKS
jgi:hypothetical protein